jgi:hypothetical protein
MSNQVDRELGWDDQIENDGSDFIILPGGDYDFEVIAFERARHNGSDKLPACNKAVVHVKIEAPEGTTTLKNNLFLHTKTEGLLCQFFTSIGQRKHGEKLQMNWNKVVGSKGRCKLIIRDWKKDDGTPMQSNEIKKFLEPAASEANKPGFEPGRF